MFLDFRQPDAPTTIRCDICIVGAGAAGITLGIALADSGLDVCVLESGGLEPDDATESLDDGESAGMENASPLGCRARYFGGSTNRWQGWCAPMAPSDFAQRPCVPHSGWPIGRSDLDPYYPRAWALCEVQPQGEQQSLDQMPSFDPEKINVGFWHFSPPTRFGSVYRPQLEDAARVTVLLHCNVVKIETDARATEVRRLRVAALNGRSGSVAANAYVLACGGMENTRLLLLTDDIECGGLGNRSGTLGRFFTQHIEVDGGQVHAADARRLLDLFERRGSSTVRAHLTNASDVQRSQRLLNTGFSFGNPRQYSSGYRALHDLWQQLGAGHWPDDFAEKVLSVSSDLDSVARDVLVTRRAPPYLTLEVYSEQTPNPDSRIGLADSKDPFGLRRIRVDWRLCAADRRSIAQSTRKLAEELGRMKIGRAKLADWLVDDSVPWPQPLWAGCHHMGTTRMSHDQDSGVVNADCRLHQVDNLYVAGSSVFPTGGYVPPTLTIIALALRLADHLHQRYV